MSGFTQSAKTVLKDSRNATRQRGASQATALDVLIAAIRSSPSVAAVADGIHLHDVIDFVLGDAVRCGREVFYRFGQQYDFVGVLRVGHRIAERAADALSVLAVGVAEGVTDRHAEEGDVDFQLAGFDEVDAAAVRVNLYRPLRMPAEMASASLPRRPEE